MSHRSATYVAAFAFAHGDRGLQRPFLGSAVLLGSEVRAGEPAIMFFPVARPCIFSDS